MHPLDVLMRSGTDVEALLRKIDGACAIYVVCDDERCPRQVRI